MWWGGGCGDGRGLGAIPAPKFLQVPSDYLARSVLSPAPAAAASKSSALPAAAASKYLARYFTGEAADRIAVGR